MFPTRKSRGPLISESCERPGLRIFLFGCLFMLIVSAYWWNFENRLAKLQPPDGSHTIINTDGILQKEDLKLLYAWRSKFQKEWNVPLLIQVSAGFLELPPYPPSTLYVGLGLKHGEAVIAVPPLVRKALGEPLRLEAEESLALCVKNAQDITALVNMPPHSEEKERSTATAMASHAAASCLNTAFNFLWKSL